MDVEVVRVWIGDPTNNGRFSGTAFFINSNTLITAKHVVKYYKESDIYINTLSDGSTLKIDKIIFCEKDIAILTIKRDFYTFPKINFTKKIEQKDRVYIKGFDGNINAPVNYLSNMVSGYEGGKYHTYRLQNYISDGYSGSPVFINNKLCGIIQARNKNKNLTYIIPITECCSEFVRKELNLISKNYIYIDSNYNDSYSSLVKNISEELNNLGHKIYLSQKDDLLQSIIELKNCKYFILFLSKDTLVSEIVIEKIKEIKKLQGDSLFPAIIPIRLEIGTKYNINYDLAKLINEIEPLIWRNTYDTNVIIQTIHKTIQNSDIPNKNNKKIRISKTDIPVPNAPLKFPNGYDERYYIEREEDVECYQALDWDERLIKIKAPKQFGKTSLLARLIKKERKKGSKIVNFNFSNTNKSIFNTIENLLYYFSKTIEKKIKVTIDTKIDGIAPNLKATEHIEEVLSISKNSIVLVIDNADELFKYRDVSNDFFGLLRGWYEEPMMNDESSLKNLKMIISHSTEAKLATTDLNKSPFDNIGVDVELKLFSKEELNQLIARYNFSLSDNELNNIINYIGGHPYLSRLTFYSILKNREPLNNILKQENKLFKDHMRRYLWEINKNEKYKDILKYILDNNNCKKIDSQECYILESIGLIKKDEFVCKLYKDFFNNYI